MINSTSAYIAIALMTAIAFVTRLLGPLIMRHVKISVRVENFLNALSSSVLAAIVATAVARGGNRELAAVLVACVVMLIVKRAVIAMLAAMLCAALWTLYLH